MAQTMFKTTTITIPNSGRLLGLSWGWNKQTCSFQLMALSILECLPVLTHRLELILGMLFVMQSKKKSLLIKTALRHIWFFFSF